ncbi:hypothetical protein SLEP1_g15444 [Rubroshorea leprosula]|uniref:Glycosyl transferase CAP10 domain-containing protein n=1 Tax=Rubroshorea leprosula TaxID=152421 RepID=A0AAV5IWS8_9ROSI|nr:hypothetical protein SLEP1_g15444 [Rubroshorea leprosula]
MNQSSLWQWRPTNRNTAVTTVIFFLLAFVVLSAFMGWFDIVFSTFYLGLSVQQQTPLNPLNCENQTKITCPISKYLTTTHNVTNPDNLSGIRCPSYFRWIHEDLRPWRETGVTKDMGELARKSENFRLVIVNGKAYLQKYMGCYETRDVFSLWGILQLLRWYPGRLPDLDMMFECGDLPGIPSASFCWSCGVKAAQEAANEKKAAQVATKRKEGRAASKHGSSKVQQAKLQMLIK